MNNRFVTIASCLLLSLAISACGSDAVATSSADTAAAPDTSNAIGAATETDAGQAPESESEPASDTEGEPIVFDGSLDLDLFFDGALASEPTTGDCTLSGGAKASCYTITVAGYPADTEIGPFCPTTIEATAADVGIWFDGNSIYDIDGDFIVGLAELYNDDNWLLYDEDGNVSVTSTAEAFQAAARPNVADEYQNHCVEGRIEWLPGSEPITTTVVIPTVPVAADSPSNGDRNLGVTLNGVSIGVAAPVDAILNAYTIAAFDDCGGHLNNGDGYHLHGALGCSALEVEGHSAIFGYALDGYGIFNPTDAEGESYDDLDECGGHSTAELGYHYHASAAKDNSVILCLTGQIAS